MPLKVLFIEIDVKFDPSREDDRTFEMFSIPYSFNCQLNLILRVEFSKDI